MRVLGIESSCDETAVAIVDDGRRRLADLVLSQLTEHRPFGGVVPEIAARSHLGQLDRLIARALAQAGMKPHELDAIAATAGPGLIGGVLVGVTMGKAMALALDRPFLAINHLEGHALSARLDPGVAFPYLLLLVSGGHCQLLRVEGVGRYRRLGTTVDDAAGEAFDKGAKILGLGYPGGPAIEQAAARAKAAGIDPDAYGLPRPMLGRPGCDFSFSGLKTALRQRAQERAADGALPERDGLALALQESIAAVLADRTAHALEAAAAATPRLTALVAAGGVAANQRIRQALERVARAHDLPLVAPPSRLCTDNAAMIAWAGIERLEAGLTDSAHGDGLDFAARPRWPLDPTAPRAAGAGVKA
ncbi:tRNA N6-adenosine threonylcarbamoyltransferase [Hypericibacter adhaerens]|uniref:tRNA N6-adenosine threonylcarbamoyltransferase n=1 Tax=Hypericibacter adhaerens TaxID=2602016 RepID=A0A5J6N8D2_9PROT|nr:tRNA (adenosine(37)-N6)-threonylcarbamoyltransferase complex transferase subunit TsaD [Hypericibacter adhaerens]QEX25220.1 tRNA N6-adenosine threonylcarbamoyltransferase [Hypericibacter adhaerens]